MLFGYFSFFVIPVPNWSGQKNTKQKKNFFFSAGTRTPDQFSDRLDACVKGKVGKEKKQ